MIGTTLPRPAGAAARALNVALRALPDEESRRRLLERYLGVPGFGEEP